MMLAEDKRQDVKEIETENDDRYHDTKYDTKENKTTNDRYDQRDRYDQEHKYQTRTQHSQPTQPTQPNEMNVQNIHLHVEFKNEAKEGPVEVETETRDDTMQAWSNRQWYLCCFTVQHLMSTGLFIWLVFLGQRNLDILVNHNTNSLEKGVWVFTMLWIFADGVIMVLVLMAVRYFYGQISSQMEERWITWRDYSKIMKWDILIMMIGCGLFYTVRYLLIENNECRSGDEDHQYRCNMIIFTVMTLGSFSFKIVSFVVYCKRFGSEPQD